MTKINIQDLTKDVTGRIEVHACGATNITGKAGIELYRLVSMKHAFGLWRKTGLQPTRGVRIKKLVQQVTGLKTRNDDVLAAKLEAMIAETDGKVLRVEVDAAGVAL